MQVEKYGYKWTKKESGYYQSTTNFPDGTRHWLHQEVFLRECGPLRAEHHIHHLDEDKDNNDPTNLDQLLGSSHCSYHMSCPDRKAQISEALKKNNASLQLLAQAAKRGEYIGKHKRRQLMKGNKHRVCEYCTAAFTLNERDREDRKFCCTECAQRASKTARNSAYKPLATSLVCKTCASVFTPLAPNQFCCSAKCRKKETEKKRLADKVFKKCVTCGEEFETIKTSKKKYCSVPCRIRN